MNKNPKVSVIIPVYNEQNSINDALESITDQSYKNLELIIVDDGSTDKTLEIIKKFKVKILSQDHKGPGVARNFGAAKATGEILIFVDADMTFDKDFVTDLVKPIISGKTIGTFSKNEMVKNDKDPISISWNINRNLPPDRMIASNYPDKAPVHRAILKEQFDKVNGFETSGQYTDDWSLSRKLNVQSTLASGAIYFHQNPSSFTEVWKQARWIGKNEFISGTFSKKCRSLIFYSLPTSILIGICKGIVNRRISFVFFKIFYDFAVWTSVLKSFFGETKFK